MTEQHHSENLGSSAKSGAKLAEELSQIGAEAQTGDQGPEARKTEFSARFSSELDRVGKDLPEVAENQDAIRHGGLLIAEEFGLHPSLLDDEGRSLMFVALSQRYGALEAQRGAGMSSNSYTKEKEFIGAAVSMLALDKSDLYPEYKDQLTQDQELSEETRERAYDKFTNLQVTADLETAIADGLLDDVKAKLGVTDENETPFKVRVINVAEDAALYAMKPTMDPELRDHTEYGTAKWRDYVETERDYKSYEAGLIKNTDEFRRASGAEGNIPVAWKTEINGVVTLVLPLPFAEKIIYPDEKRSVYYSEKDRERDLAILRHEYTHTQGGLTLNEGTFFDIAAEERRAEYFSGDRQGYGDVKAMFRYFRDLTGLDLTMQMEAEPKGGTAYDFNIAVAQRVGLQRGLEFALTPPSAYVQDSEPLQSEAASYLGGFDTLTHRIYDDELAAGRGHEIEQRLTTTAQHLLRVLPEKESLEGYLSYQESLHDVPFVTGLIRKKIAELGGSDTHSVVA